MFGRNFVARQRENIIFVCLLLATLVSLSFSTRQFMLSPKEIGLTVFSVFQDALSTTVGFVASTVDSVRELGELRREYAEALERLAYLERIEKDLAILDRENRMLREILSFSRALPTRNVPAKIIAKDPDNFNTSIVINKGRLDGLDRNMPVVAIQDGQQGLVGKILTVGLNSSIIQPVYDRNSYVAARLLNSRYEGLANGKGGIDTKLYMRYVKKTARDGIRYGDMVISSGMTSIFPMGIYLGTVTSIISRYYESSLELELDPVVDFARLEYVYVLVPEP